MWFYVGPGFAEELLGLLPQIVSNGSEHKLLIGAEDEGRSGILANVYESQGHAHTFGQPG